MHVVRKSLLDALADYQKMIREAWFTIGNTLDRIVGLDSCPIAIEYRKSPYPLDHPEWIKWRAEIYIQCRFWRGHLDGTEQALKSAKEFPNLEHYVEAAKPSVNSHRGFDVIRHVEAFLHNSRWKYVNCLLPEPCYESWTEKHAKCPRHLAKSLSSPPGPEILFGKDGKPGRLRSAIQELGDMLLGTGDRPDLSRRLRQHGGDGTLDDWQNEFEYLTDLQFAEAKRLAIVNPPSTLYGTCRVDDLVSDLIPRLRNHGDRMFDDASLARLTVTVDRGEASPDIAYEKFGWGLRESLSLRISWSYNASTTVNSRLSQ